MYQSFNTGGQDYLVSWAAAVGVPSSFITQLKLLMAAKVQEGDARMILIVSAPGPTKYSLYKMAPIQHCIKTGHLLYRLRTVFKLSDLQVTVKQ